MSEGERAECDVGGRAGGVKGHRCGFGFVIESNVAALAMEELVQGFLGVRPWSLG